MSAVFPAVSISIGENKLLAFRSLGSVQIIGWTLAGSGEGNGPSGSSARTPIISSEILASPKSVILTFRLQSPSSSRASHRGDNAILGAMRAPNPGRIDNRIAAPCARVDRGEPISDSSHHPGSTQAPRTAGRQKPPLSGRGRCSDVRWLHAQSRHSVAKRSPGRDFLAALRAACRPALTWGPGPFIWS